MSDPSLSETAALGMGQIDPETQRKRVAMALQLQRGMLKHPWGQLANQALSIWNMKRAMPAPSQSMPSSSYPIETVGGG